MSGKSSAELELRLTSDTLTSDVMTVPGEAVESALCRLLSEAVPHA